MHACLRLDELTLVLALALKADLLGTSTDLHSGCGCEWMGASVAGRAEIGVWGGRWGGGMGVSDWWAVKTASGL